MLALRNENKDKAASKQNFEEMKPDLKKAGEKIEKAISDGASAVPKRSKRLSHRRKNNRADLPPGYFLPHQMDEGFKGRKILCVCLGRADPEVDLHPGGICLAARKCPPSRIVNRMCQAIAGSFHDHEMG